MLKSQKILLPFTDAISNTLVVDETSVEGVFGDINKKRCKVEGCVGKGRFCKKGGKHYFIKGYCNAHYLKLYKHGDATFERGTTKDSHCKVEGCTGNGKNSKRGGAKYLVNGYCNKHYQRIYKNGGLNNGKFVRGELNMSSFKAYFIHVSMKERCFNKNQKNYKLYGGRGITICDRWLGLEGFWNFLEDMGERPSTKHSIDRIDNDKGYSPDNCRWATIHEQNANRRTNRKTVGVFRCGKKWGAEIWVDNKIYRKSGFTYWEAVRYRKQLEINHLKY